jgi:serine phosphatase RsbU (regulator of sigma subunit)
LLPATLPEIKGYQIAAAIKTANEIGGDFYDILPLNDDSYLFTIGDVSGKGSSAAFYMAQFISLLRYSPQFTDSPVEIAERLNAYFSKEIKDRQIFVTSIIGVLNVKSNTIKFVRNGHTPPILIPGDGKKDVAEITSDGLGIGLTKTGQTFKNSLKEKTIRLKANDKFILYTDGIVEAAITSEDEEFTEVFGEDKFNFLLNKIRDENAEVIKKEVCNVLDDFYQSRSPIDDYTLLIIQRSGGRK